MFAFKQVSRTHSYLPLVDQTDNPASKNKLLVEPVKLYWAELQIQIEKGISAIETNPFANALLACLHIIMYFNIQT